MQLENTPAESTPPKLLDLVRDKIRIKHYSIRTEMQYLQWVKRFIIFCVNRGRGMINPSNQPVYFTGIYSVSYPCF